MGGVAIVFRSHKERCSVCKDAERAAVQHLRENPRLNHARAVIENVKHSHTVIVERVKDRG